MRLTDYILAICVVLLAYGSYQIIELKNDLKSAEASYAILQEANTEYLEKAVGILYGQTNEPITLGSFHGIYALDDCTNAIKGKKGLWCERH